MRLADRLKAVLAHLPHRSPYAVARRLTVRANAARDARQWQIAAALYQAAVRFAPNARIHKQCGHMFKEAGLLDAAEEQYLAAARLDPDDADLSLQIGHFEKLRGNFVDAEAAYARALALKPGWVEPAQELARLRTGAPATPMTRQPPRAVVPELLPDEAAQPRPSFRETIQIRRLGAALVNGPQGYRRTLRGIEAIRGHCVAVEPMVQLTILLDGDPIAEAALATTPLPDGRHVKAAFNVWHDFSTVPVGQHRIELRFQGARGARRVHRADVHVAAPVREADYPDSDAVVEAPPRAGASLEERINAKPSIVRPARRRPLARARSILVQRVDQMGDLVVSVPALRRLRALFEDARIVLLASPANAPFASTLDCVDEVIVAEVDQREGRLAIGLEAQERLAAALAHHDFDIAIDLSQDAGSRALLRLAGARFRYGLAAPFAPWLSSSFNLATPDPIDGLEACSPARKLVAMVEALGAMAADPAPPPREGPRTALAERHGVLPRERFVVLHAGARLAMNRWPGFAELARMILAGTDLTVVLLGDPPGGGIAAGDRLRILAEILPFDAFDALLASCAVFVGNDSGPKHLAALRNAPVVSLHPARLNWNEWGQEGTGSIISRRVPCAGCAIDRAPEECGKDFACLRMIAPDEVYREVVRLASRSSP